MTRISVIAFLLFFMNSCYDCEDRGEPSLQVQFFNGRYYTHIYGVGGKGDIASQEYYPIAIDSDTTIYVFEGDGYTDTLAFSYRRNVSYESEECGFTIQLDSFKLLSISTFESVAFYIFDTKPNSYYSKSNLYEAVVYY